MTVFFADRAWLGPAEGAADSVVIETEAGRTVAVRGGAEPPADAVRLPGLVLPGLANSHSHAFHRALRGRVQSGTGDFWTWREQMYAAAARLTPERYLRLARATYAEMALAGVTTVVEFHYLHHDVEGGRYRDPLAMAAALIAAARDAGVNLCLLDVCYLQADVDGTPLSGPQLRFGDGGVDSWATRAQTLAELEGDAEGPARVGAAIHSVRGVPPEAMREVAAWARERDAPLHLHLSEQVRENESCLAAFGCTPTRLCADNGVLGPNTTAVHGTHLTQEDVDLLGLSGTTVCFCPTTERDLADGIGPASKLHAAKAPLSLGSDSHAVIDLFEEARAVELNERLATRRRGNLPAETLLRAAGLGGAASSGLDVGRIAAGALADFVAVDDTAVRMAGAAADPATALVYAATAAEVTHVVRGGRTTVDQGRHLAVPDAAGELEQVIDELYGGD